MYLPRSSYYYRRKAPSDEAIRHRIGEVAAEFPSYGYRRITAQLHREHYDVNHKKVLRVMREESLLCKTRPPCKRTTYSDHARPRFPNLAKDVAVNTINQVWVADITYIRILTAFVYLAVILDVFSRRVLGYALSRSLDTGFALLALRMAITRRNPEPGCIHHSDQGIQYASNEYIAELQKHNFHISMAARGNPYENAYAESFMKTLKHEEVYFWEYRTIKDVADRIPFFIQEVYNTKRLHSSLGYMSPVEFEINMCEKERRADPVHN
jgi:putative transposase